MSEHVHDNLVFTLDPADCPVCMKAKIAALQAQVETIARDYELLKARISDHENVGQAFLAMIDEHEPDATWDTCPTEVYVRAIDERDALTARCKAQASVIAAQDKLLVAYRVGSSTHAGKAIDALIKARAALAATEDV